MDRKRDLISEIMDIEWAMFTSVRNRGGRASCQEDPDMFRIIRTSTFLTWSETTLESYLGDLTRAKEAGSNLMTGKYARMEGISAPLDPEVAGLIDECVKQECLWAVELMAKYPDAKLARPIYSSQNTPYVVSSETYSRGELATYSKKTLELYRQDMLDMKSRGLNRIEVAIGMMTKKFAEQSKVT
jgi:hypothetical protein